MTAEAVDPISPVQEIPASLLHPLTSLTERLEIERLFPVSRPLEVELGCGDGSFLLEYARRHPERSFLGVERLLGRIRKIDRKGRRLGLANIRGLRIEASYLLEWLLPAGCAMAVHVYFPDPWPKRKHRHHRLINERFPGLAHTLLTSGGQVHLRTDDLDYFTQMQSVFRADARFRPVDPPEELTMVTTDFEVFFAGQGLPIHRASYHRLD